MKQLIGQMRSKMKKSSLTEKAQQKLKQTENQIQHQYAELQAVQQKKNSITTEIETETDRLLSERNKNLSDLESKIKKSIQPLEIEVYALKEQVDKLTLDKSLLETDIYGKHVALKELENTLSEINSILEVQNSSLVSLKCEQDEVNNNLTDLRKQTLVITDQKNGLEDEIKSKVDIANEEIETLRIQIDELETQIKRKNDILVNESLEKEKRITVLDDKITQQIRQIQQTDAEQGLIRKDLATRQIALDEREKVLKIRERKVEMGLERIQMNAGLMEL